MRPVIDGIFTHYLTWTLDIDIYTQYLSWFHSSCFSIHLLPKELPKKQFFDWIGFVCCGLGLMLFAYGLEMISHSDKRIWINLIISSAGIVLLVIDCFI